MGCGGTETEAVGLMHVVLPWLLATGTRSYCFEELGACLVSSARVIQ